MSFMQDEIREGGAGIRQSRIMQQACGTANADFRGSGKWLGLALRQPVIP
jgi:hypothetical protein